MLFPWQMALGFAIVLAVDAIGFKSYTWFFAVGYGFSIAALGLMMVLLFPCAGFVPILLCLILIVYGCRLGGYLLLREKSSAGYRNRLKGEIKDNKEIPIGVKCTIWLSCVVLYILQVSPVLYRLCNGTGVDAWCVIGAVIMAIGFGIEMLADIQKQRAKKKNPSRFCDEGLYKLVRCPNYFGELVFWAGAVVSGIGSVTGWQWVIVLLGYICITYVMFSGARRVELRQNSSYNNDPEYQQYVKNVPILFPFVPLYSVVKYKFLVA